MPETQTTPETPVNPDQQPASKKLNSLKKLKIKMLEAEADYLFALAKKRKNKLKKLEAIVALDDLLFKMSKQYHSVLYQNLNEAAKTITELDTQSLNLLLKVPENEIFPSEEMKKQFFEFVKTYNHTDGCKLLQDCNKLKISSVLANDFFEHHYSLYLSSIEVPAEERK